MEWWQVRGRRYDNQRKALRYAQRKADELQEPVAVWRYLAVGSIEHNMFPKRKDK
jgi:hypothetical protein